MTVLKSKKEYPNLEITFPIIGKKKFNENSEIEVEDHLVSTFLNIQCGFSFEIVDVNSSKDEKSIYENELNKLAIEEIDTLIGTYSKEEIKSLKSKVKKIEFLVKKQFEN